MSRIFDNTTQSQYCSTPSSPVYNNLTEFTMSGRLFIPSPETNAQFAFVKNPHGTYDPNFYLDPVGLGALTVSAGAGASSDTITTTVLTTDTWHNVLITFSNSGDRKIRIYFDGVECSYLHQIAASGPLPDNSGEGYFIGDDGFHDTNGVVQAAEMAVWNRVLTLQEISSVATTTTGVSGIAAANLVGYWHLCGTASPEPDASGNGNVATLSASAPVKGPNSPGFNCPPAHYSVPDCRNYAIFPNNSRNVNGTLTYDVPSLDSRVAGAPVDSRVAGAPVASGTYPQNSRTPGTFGPGE